MTDMTALHSEQHRDLRVVMKRGAEFGEDIHIMTVVADELRNLALEYPVIAVKAKKHDLLESVQLDVRFADGKQRQFDGLYTVREEKLSNLEDEVLLDLHKRGFLQGAWLMLASLGNVRKLLTRKALREAAERKDRL